MDFDLCARLQNWGHENLRNLIKDSTKSPVLVNNANIIECEEILHGDSQQLEENVRENSLNRSIELLRTNPLNRPLEILEERNALEAEPNDTINEFVVTCKSPESLESNDILTVQSEYDMVHILDNYLSNVNSCEVALTQRILSNSCPMESIGILVAFQVTREIFSEKSIIHRFLSFNDEFLRFTVQVLSTVLRDATIVKITYDWKSLFKFIMQYTGMNVVQFYPIKNLFDMKVNNLMNFPPCLVFFKKYITDSGMDAEA